jgi:hypothetical protein
MTKTIWTRINAGAILNLAPPAQQRSRFDIGGMV